MKRPVSLLLLLFVITWAVSSCGLPHEGHQYIYVRTSKKAKILYRPEYDGMVWRGRLYQLGEDSVMNVKGYKAQIAVPDSDTPVPVTVRRNGMEGTVYIQPVHEFFLKLDKDKFGFPRKVFADLDDTGKAFYRYKRSKLLISQYKAPYWSLDFTPPIFNWFGYGLKDMADAGVFGYCMALNYHYKKAHALSFEVGGILSSDLRSEPSKITASTPYKYNKVSGWFVSVKEVHALGRCELGYGAYVGGYYGKSYYNTLYTKEDSLGYSRNAFGLGLCASAYFRLLNFLSIGGSFQPELICIDKSVSVGFESVYNVGLKLRIPHLRDE